MNEQQRSARQGIKREPDSGPTPRGTARPARSLSTTGAAERDEVYGVVSVLYHALQAADTVTQYSADARRANDQELVGFFDETRDQFNEIASRAKELLSDRLGDYDEEDDEEDDEDGDDTTDDEDDERED